MKRIIGALSVAVLAGLVLSNDAYSSFLHSPHGESHGLDCKTCHEYPFDNWPSYVDDPANPDDTGRNFVCFFCHDAANPNPSYPDAPKSNLHSSLVMTGAPGWTLDCVDCHDPHFQSQLQHLQDPSLYIVTGSFTNALQVNGSGPTATSSFNITLNNTSSNWSNPADWSAKSSANRGLLLTPDTQNPMHTYEVLSSDGSSMTVAGDLTGITFGSEFGLIYGQFIRNMVNLPDNATFGANAIHQVKFFEPVKSLEDVDTNPIAGGFVDLTSNDPVGICQVCHTVTTHWNYDGSLATHNLTSLNECIDCHSHSQGFKAQFGGHDFVFDDICFNCHVDSTASDPKTDNTDIIAYVHNSTCGLCHVDPAGGGTLRVGPNGNGDATQATAGQDACTTCHGSYFPNHDHDHTIKLTDTAFCVSCHLANDPLASHPANNARDGEVSSCDNCHSITDGSRIVGVNGWGDATVNNSDGGACADCHASFPFELHSHDHTAANEVTPNTLTSPPSVNCVGCHDGLNVINDIHPPNAGEGETASCHNCHNMAAGGALQGSAAGHRVPEDGPSNECNTCHTAYFNGHSHTHDVLQDSTDLAQGSPGALCNSCHGNFTNNWSGIYALHLNDCTKCHDSTRSTYNPSDPTETVQDIIRGTLGTVNCLDCHRDKETPAEHGSHPVDAFNWDSNCQDCHGAGAGAELVVSEIHNNTCTVCHDTSSGPATRDNERLGAATFGTDGDAREADGTALAAETDINAWNTPTCTTCHPSATYTWTSIHTVTPTPVDHSVTVTNNDATCNGCHDAVAGGTAPDAINSPFVGSGEVHNNTSGQYSGTCANCHTSNGGLQLAPSRAPLLSANGGNCSACHDVYFDNHTHSHATSVTIPSNTTDPSTLNCLTSGCHVATSSPFENEATIHAAGTYAAGDCATCHDPATGAFISTSVGDASGTNGECANCHNAFDQHLSHTPTVHAVSMGTDQSSGTSCNVCHGTFTDTWGGGNGIYALHNNTCATCHDSNRNDADGNVQAEIQEGTATCLECHASKVNEHGSHPVDAFNWDSNCQDCHGAGAGAELVVSEIHNNTCTVCHDTSSGPATRDNERLGAATFGTDGDAREADGTALAAETDINAWNTPTCTTCHPSATYTWTSIHTVTPTPVDHSVTVTNNDATCNGCHDAVAGGTAPDAINSPFVGSGEVHNNTSGQYSGTCANCHTSNGGLQLAPSRAPLLSANGGNCSACHDVYFDNHTHSHAASLSVSVGCIECHGNAVAGTDARDAISAPWIGASEVHADQQCATCHSSTDGSPKGSATKWGSNWDARSSGECTTCHDQNWTAIHDNATGVTHNGRVNFYPACVNCHVSNNPDSNARPAPPGEEPWVITGQVHAGNGCGTCHTGNNDGGLRSGGFSKADQVVANGPSVCYDCHMGLGTTWAVRHTGANGLDHTGRVDELGTCAACHDATAGGPNGYMPVDNTPGTKVHDECYSCHDSTVDVNLGQLQNIIATGGSLPIAKGDCGTCHSSTYFDNHDHHNGGNNDMSYDPNGIIGDGDTSQPAEQGCMTSGCHDAFNLNTPGGIIEEHLNDCGTCHTATRSTGVNPPYAGIPDVIANGTQVTCDTCHDDKTPNVQHGGHEGAFNRIPNCTTACHPGADITQLHVDRTGDCGTCHVSTSGGGTLRGGAVGQTLNSSCADCHGGSDPKTVHHATTAAFNGDCVNCHAPDGPGNALPVQAACLHCHIETTTDGLRVKRFDLNRIITQTTDPVDPFVGYVPSHTFSGAGAGITINDYGVCFNCHAASAAAKGTVAVRPFHGFSSAMHQGDERNAKDITRIQVFQHPGHGFFNEFASLMNNRNGNWNHKLFSDYDSKCGSCSANDNGDYPKDIGKSGSPLGYPLRDLEGDAFNSPASGFGSRKSVPFDQWGAMDGPYNVPHFD